jgi:hypothetical protein
VGPAIPSTKTIIEDIHVNYQCTEIIQGAQGPEVGFWAAVRSCPAAHHRNGLEEIKAAADELASEGFIAIERHYSIAEDFV